MTVKDFLDPKTHKHNWCITASRTPGVFADYRVPYNEIVLTYDISPEFRDYIKTGIKDGKSTKQQIIDLSSQENREKATKFVETFYDEN